MLYPTIPQNRIVNDGLVLYLDAGIKGSYSGTGTNWNDLASVNNATLVNNPPFSQSAFVFNGANNYASATTLGNFGSSMTNGFTLDFAIKVTNKSQIYQFAGILNDGTKTALAINLNRDRFNSYLPGTTSFYIRSDDSSSISTDIATNIYTGDWFIVTSIYNEIPAINSVFVNGGLVASSTNGSISGTLSNFQYPFYIGAANNRGAPDFFAPASCGYFRIYNSPLTNQEVLQNFEATRGRFSI